MGLSYSNVTHCVTTEQAYHTEMIKELWVPTSTPHFIYSFTSSDLWPTSWQCRSENAIILFVQTL